MVEAGGLLPQLQRRLQKGNLHERSRLRPADQERARGAPARQRGARSRHRHRRRQVRARWRPASTPARAKAVHDGKGRLAFPGVVDAHMHSGIYSPLAEDAVSESKAAAMGGVTSSLNYFRTGQYYLNKGGPYAKFFPEVLKISQGPLPRRLRLSPGADGQHAHRRDPDADREARRRQLQDLHVLRLARPARRERHASASS